jgi:hypothetical protein
MRRLVNASPSSRYRIGNIVVKWWARGHLAVVVTALEAMANSSVHWVSLQVRTHLLKVFPNGLNCPENAIIGVVA